MPDRGAAGGGMHLLAAIVAIIGCGTPTGAPDPTWTARLGPPAAGWALVDVFGEPFTEADLSSGTAVVAVGSTRTEQTTPRATAVLHAMAQARPGLQVLFVTVDPSDTKAAVVRFLRPTPTVRGLLPTGDGLHAVMASLGTAWVPSSTEPDRIDHSTSLVVLRDGRRVGYLHRPTDPERALRDLDRLVE